MFLSIIIPVYKVEQYIERCIDSCLNQNISTLEYEIIVVDDGSPDNSGSIADRYAQKYKNIRVIHKKNGGLSSARNCGLEESTGDYIWFIDSDDWIAENKLSLIITSIQRYNPDAIRIEAENVDGANSTPFYTLENNTITSGKETLLALTLPCVPFFIWKRSVFIDNNQKFVEGILHEDMEFTPRVICMCKRVLNIAEVLYFVYVNLESITKSINPKKSFDYIDHVCPSLYNFSRTLEKKYRTKFDYLIAMCINNAISNIDNQRGEIVDRVNLSIHNHREFISCFWTSQLFKYRIECIMFKLFPAYYVQVFRFMDKINKR